MSIRREYAVDEGHNSADVSPLNIRIQGLISFASIRVAKKNALDGSGFKLGSLVVCFEKGEATKSP